MSARRTEPQIIEHFHLAFLQVLQSRLPQTQYIVKGGVNLRYFFNSHRYSEDIDLDAVAVEPWALEEKVDAVLESAAEAALLRAGGLQVHEITKPKQTDTTQRWKAMISAQGRRDPVRTKIEFSHREARGPSRLEAVPDRVVAPYALRPPTMQHYLAEGAIEQKVVALARRNETQARDVFDLELLLRQRREVTVAHLVDEETRLAAQERAIELAPQAFEDQVLPFLDQEVAELYSAPDSWEQMRAFVIDRLGDP
jgi:predicted nucleotidyltransferase component of viral defense system